MEITRTENILLEILDQGNQGICVMPARDVLRQKLRHRAVAIILRDGRGRILLSGGPATGWGFSASGILPAWMDSESQAEKLAAQAWPGCRGRLHLIGICQPCAENHNALTRIFELHTSAVWIDYLAAEQEKHLLLDHDSLRGLLAMDTDHSLIARDLTTAIRQSAPLARRLLGEDACCLPPDQPRTRRESQDHC